MLPAHLLPILERLRAAYPAGVPDEDYLPLLAALRNDLSDDHLAQVVAELVDDEVVVVDNDAAKIEGRLRPAPSEVERVRARLISAGYEFDSEEGCSLPSAND
jgi:Protein of unknown function (DUF3349)